MGTDYSAAAYYAVDISDYSKVWLKREYLRDDAITDLISCYDYTREEAEESYDDGEEDYRDAFDDYDDKEFIFQDFNLDGIKDQHYDLIGVGICLGATDIGVAIYKSFPDKNVLSKKFFDNLQEMEKSGKFTDDFIHFLGVSPKILIVECDQS